MPVQNQLTTDCMKRYHEVRKLGKVSSLAEAVATVSNGAVLSFSGFAHSLVSTAFARELIRQGRRDLRLVAMGEAWAADILAGAGALREVWMSNFMFEGFGLCRNFDRAVERGDVVVHDYSHFGITLALQATALGVPWLPLDSMRGTDLARQLVTLPGRPELSAVQALRTDVAILHSHWADPDGNAGVLGVTGISSVLAAAADRIIVTTEHLVSQQEFKRICRRTNATVIPGLFVSHVAHVPYGSHPAGMYAIYDIDKPAIDEYLTYAQRGDFSTYTARYIFGVSDHYGYLSRFGVSRLLALRADPTLGYSPIQRSRW